MLHFFFLILKVYLKYVFSCCMQFIDLKVFLIACGSKMEKYSSPSKHLNFYLAWWEFIHFSLIHINVSTCGNRYRVNCMIYNYVREKVSCMMLDDTKKMSCYGNVQTKSTMFRGADLHPKNDLTWHITLLKNNIRH